MWLRKRHIKRETESLLIAAQNNAIRTNHIKARIHETQHNSRYKLCGDRDETINLIREHSKLAQKKYKTRQLWVCEVIHSKLCEKLIFDHTNTCTTPESVLENEAHKLLCDFEIRMNHLISARPYNKLATVVEGDPKAPFSIATTPRCRGGCYSFPWIAPLYP